jgi:hypothetical protein
MKRPDRALDGFYYIKSLGDVKAGKGRKFKELFGSREQVMNGTAYKTPGGLTVDDLIMNKYGRIVSKKKHFTAKKEKRLEKYGYFAKKGKFGYIKRKTRRNRKTVGGGKDLSAAQLEQKGEVDPNDDELKAEVEQKAEKA